MNHTIITTITAVWGAITGTISLVWNFYFKSKETSHLKISLSKHFATFISPPELIYVQSTTFNQPIGVINVLLVNKGAKLESIHDIRYYNKTYKKWFPVSLENFFIKSMSEQIKKNVTAYHTLSVSKQTKLPLNLDGYESQEHKFLIFLPKEFKDNTKIKLMFVTSRKKYRFSFQIQSLDHILPDWKKYKIAE